MSWFSCLVAVMSLAQAQPPLEHGSHKLELVVEGVYHRTAWLHVPTQVAAGEALPLVINYHGWGGKAFPTGPNGRGEPYGMDLDLADREGFMGLYPQVRFIQPSAPALLKRRCTQLGAHTAGCSRLAYRFAFTVAMIKSTAKSRVVHHL
jgi:poly(3-hydroxybutyrate) depolymerase